MNERIKQLAIESGLVSESWNNRLVSSFVEDSDVSEELKDFAELIIKECIDKVSSKADRWGTMTDEVINMCILECAVDLKKHFGVE
jgi:hypothetical protein